MRCKVHCVLNISSCQSNRNQYRDNRRHDKIIIFCTSRRLTMNIMLNTKKVCTRVQVNVRVKRLSAIRKSSVKPPRHNNNNNNNNTRCTYYTRNHRKSLCRYTIIPNGIIRCAFGLVFPSLACANAHPFPTQCIGR